MDYTLQELSTMMNGSTLIGDRGVRVTHIVYDSRKVIKSSTGLFVAIAGEIHNGHQYVREAYEKGVRSFLVTTKTNLPKDANQLVVDDVMASLHQVTCDYRAKITYPIIGVTGSNGKTIVKEWLSTVLVASGMKVQKNPKSYNSQLGVALSILDFDFSADVGIVEAGISEVGEMEKLERIIKPTFGLFTNLGSAHETGFSSTWNKFDEKALLFKNVQKIIADASYPFDERQVSYGEGYKGDYKVEVHHDQLVINGELYSSPFADDVSIQNVLSCIVMSLELGIDSKKINESLSLLTPIRMRLEVKEGINNCHIIDDSYNNDLIGINTAFAFLDQQHFNGNRTLILSDILESDEDAYEELKSMILSYNFSKVYLIGKGIKELLEFDPSFKWFDDTASFFEGIVIDEFRDEVILVKGARKYGLEKIVAKLQRRLHRTTFEVNLNAIAQNLNVYRAKLKPTTKVMAMVKAFSYGAGDAEIAGVLEFQKVDYLAVAYVDEGVKLRLSGVSLPIMVMNAPSSDCASLYQYNLEPEVFTLSQVKEMASIGLGLKLHLKLDTGMHRLGFEESEIDTLLSVLADNPQLQVVSAFTHLSGTDESKFDEFTNDQIKRYTEIVERLKNRLNTPFMKHVLNSAGITRFDEYQFDMVRLGIGLYGVGATEEVQQKLEQVGTLKTIVSQVKRVNKGGTIGYSRMGKALDDKLVATIAIGYADGFDRRFGNGAGSVLIGGELFPTIGNVCMDMTMIDITGRNQIKAGDEVVVYGRGNSVQKMAEAIHTIPYELLTAIGERVKRIYYLEE